MRIKNNLTHLIIMTVKNISSKETFIIIVDLFKLEEVLIKKIIGNDQYEINKTILNFYKLYTKHYELLSTIPEELEKIEDLEKTDVLIINFSITYNSAVEISETKWWNEKDIPNPYITSINLVPYKNLAFYNESDLNQFVHELKSNISWKDINIYISYNIFLFLKHISKILKNNTFHEKDITKYI